ncbi:MAG TPA: outer membrane protein assembly factor BamE [Caulobacteraceae bacterium]|jgi:outer membrane protein assembly factor BamE (lipoprotein component of BamABCDE complex)|nr:outer membrane protein assembly factor BamE [Caulobacteraceae bacterium]
MARTSVIALAALGLVGLSMAACAPTVAYNGFQAREDKPQDVKVGEDTKSTVTARLGSPSTTSSFEPNTWYYISQSTTKVAYQNPKLISRDVVEIKFGPDEKVTEVKHLGLKNGYELAYNKNETPTRGRELSVLEQLLGNIGRGSVMPTDVDPGQRPGGR